MQQTILVGHLSSDQQHKDHSKLDFLLKMAHCYNLQYFVFFIVFFSRRKIDRMKIQRNKNYFALQFYLVIFI